jgi:hypothetical protein
MPAAHPTPPTPQVSWDWACESTVLYRAVAYLDAHVAGAGVPHLGVFQVRHPWSAEGVRAPPRPPEDRHSLFLAIGGGGGGGGRGRGGGRPSGEPAKSGARPANGFSG